MAKKDDLNERELAEGYGFARDLFYSDSELKALLKKAVKEDWSPDMFQAKVRGTKWWKSKSEAERKYLALQYGDPATAKQNYGEAFTRIRQMAERLGITYSKSKDKVAEAALNVVSKGWTDEQVRYFLGQYVGFSTSSGYAPGGEGAAAYDSIKQLAYNYGITLDNKWVADQARLMIRGLTTQEDVKSTLKNKAIAAFPTYKDQLNAGQSMTDIAAPYMQQMSQLLELAPGSVNLFDPTIKKALSTKDDKGKPASVPLWQFENELKQDPRWRQTQNAQDSVMTTAHGILSSLGLKY